MHDLDSYIEECFTDYFCSHDKLEKRVIAERFMNDDKSVVMYEELHDWVDETLVMLLNGRCPLVDVLHKTLLTRP